MKSVVSKKRKKPLIITKHRNFKIYIPIKKEISKMKILYSIQQCTKSKHKYKLTKEIPRGYLKQPHQCLTQ